MASGVEELVILKEATEPDVLLDQFVPELRLLSATGLLGFQPLEFNPTEVMSFRFATQLNPMEALTTTQ